MGDLCRGRHSLAAVSYTHLDVYKRQGISNADGSLIQHDSDNIVVWNREELNLSSDTFELSMQFRIITEYVAPNYENVYPDDITKYMEPISWEAHFGE